MQKERRKNSPKQGHDTGEPKRSPERRELIRKAVKKVVEDYGETLRMLGRE